MVAEYRAGNMAAAVAALEQFVRLKGGGDPHPTGWFVLAMAHWQLGHREPALKLYSQAAERVDKTKSNDKLVRRFRAEAAQLLGIPEGAKDSPPPPGND